MRRLIAVLAIFCAFTLTSVTSAEARWFEPQANWRNAGVSCAASRHPPARRWRASPPRVCAVSEAALIVSVAKVEPLPALETFKQPEQFA